MSDGNIRDLGVKPDELKGLIDKVTRSLADQIELERLLAKISFEKFKALKECGFTDDQALQLVKR